MRKASIARALRGAAVCSLFTGVAVGQAGGLFLPANGGPSNGTAQAGSASVARDAETAWLNPAGMTRLDSAEVILSHVQLPLAMRTIMAGVRTSTVISIGVATLAAFTGAGGLGEPIVDGLYLNDTGLILTGAVPAALLAVLADVGLGRIERALGPRTRTAQG